MQKGYTDEVLSNLSSFLVTKMDTVLYIPIYTVCSCNNSVCLETIKKAAGQCFLKCAFGSVYIQSCPTANNSFSSD